MSCCGPRTPGSAACGAAPDQSMRHSLGAHEAERERDELVRELIVADRINADPVGKGRPFHVVGDGPRIRPDRKRAELGEKLPVGGFALRRRRLSALVGAKRVRFRRISDAAIWPSARYSSRPQASSPWGYSTHPSAAVIVQDTSDHDPINGTPAVGPDGLFTCGAVRSAVGLVAEWSMTVRRPRCG